MSPHDGLPQAGEGSITPSGFCHDKGSHDVWRNTETGKSIPLPKEVPSRHFANRILKEAGLKKKF
jgi:hypothetical protein